MKREEQRTRVRNLAISAMLAALGTVLLSVGALFETLDLSVAALASFLIVYAVIELRGGYPWAIWLVTGLLGLLLLPRKSAVLFYLAFLGFYPILKAYFERLPRLASWILKLISFHLSLGVILMLVRYVFVGALELPTGTYLWILWGMGLVCFVVYDIALTRMISFYLFRLQKHLRPR